MIGRFFANSESPPLAVWRSSPASSLWDDAAVGYTGAAVALLLRLPDFSFGFEPVFPGAALSPASMVLSMAAISSYARNVICRSNSTEGSDFSDASLDALRTFIPVLPYKCFRMTDGAWLQLL